MPDLMPILQGVSAAALIAAAAMLLFGLPWRTPHPVCVRFGGVLGVGLACLVGCWLAGARLHWPPQEIHDRFLLIILPAAIAVELIGAFLGGLPWLIWLMRIAIAGGAARVLLDNTTYLADSVGNSEAWTPAHAWLVLMGLALALAVEWALLISLVRRAPGRAVTVALAIACAGGAVAVMLSGFFTGGPPGLVFAAALSGAMLASIVLKGPPDVTGIVGLGIVGLFALVISGHFMSELTATNAALVFASPLLCWLPELPPRLRGVAKVALAAVPVAVAVLLAQQGSNSDSNRPASNSQSSVDSQPASSNEPTLQDYINFRK